MSSDLLARFPVVVTVPVRWGDMDAYQHVNNTKYFVYFESARIAYFQKATGAETSGLPQGVGPILASTSCRFRAPVTYPDTLRIGARVVELGEDRFRMEYVAVSERLGCIAADGEATVVTYDYDSGRKAPVPDTWVEAIRAIEGDRLS